MNFNLKKAGFSLKQTVFVLFSLPGLAFAQDSTKQSRFFRKDVQRKGDLYVYWGYNRGEYTNSDITFRGDTYYFTLHNVAAVDKPEHFSFSNYFSPESISIPQYNFTFGYYITNRFSISFNDDHMKYVVSDNQTVKIDGVINPAASTEFAGSYVNQDLYLDSKFMHFEHTDGLNYLNLEASWAQEIYSTKNGVFAIDGILGAGGGVMLPKSNVTLLNYGRNDQFHVAGFGVSGHLGLNLLFFNRVFIQGNLKGGMIDMPDIVVRLNSTDRASQHFYFLQENIVFGVNIHLKKHKRYGG